MKVGGLPDRPWATRMPHSIRQITTSLNKGYHSRTCLRLSPLFILSALTVPVQFWHSLNQLNEGACFGKTSVYWSKCEKHGKMLGCGPKIIQSGTSSASWIEAVC